MNLKLSEIFHSIQGESTFAGRPCVFVRFAECNLRCAWCDSKFSFRTAFEMPVADTAEIAASFRCRLVQITGGEPLLQREGANALAAMLFDAGHEVLMETVLSLPMGGVDPRIVKIVDIKCPGSGMGDKMLLDELAAVQPHDQFKFVIKDRADFDWAVALLRERPALLEHECLFSPVTHVLPPHDLAEWILDSRLPVRFQMQMHRELRTEETRDSFSAHLMRMKFSHPAIVGAQARHAERKLAKA